MIRPVLIVTTVVLITTLRVGAEDMAKLVSEGKAVSKIVISTQAAPDEKLAVEELRTHIKRMSGAELAETAIANAEELAALIKKENAAGATPIVIGALGLTDVLKAKIQEKGTDPASFIVKADVSSVVVAGLSPEGTLFAAYELLEQLGCRWFTPGEFGTVIPDRKTVMLPVRETIQTPSFAGRHLQTIPSKDPWYRRNRLGGPFFPSAHGLPIGKATVQDNPELFSLVNGKRVARQHCVSNPEVLRRVVENVKAGLKKHPDAPWIGMGPNDGGGFCECEKCRALDGGDRDPFDDSVSMTDRYVWFFNKVLEGIRDEYPNTRLGFYSYHTYMRPPLKVKPDPRVVPAFAPISLCRVHGMSNPICPERSYYRTLMEGWGKIVPQVFERGYFFNLADPGFLFSKVHAVRDEIHTAKKLGIYGWRVETMPHWGAMTPTIHVAARLFWNCDADVDAMLRDFYETFFGTAAAPMGKYCDRVDRAFRDGDFHTGCSFDLPHFFPPETMKELRGALEEAEKLATADPYKRRVAAWRLMYDYLDNFLLMLSARDAFDFASAQKHLERLREIQKAAYAHDPPLLYASAATSYLRRFWSQCTEQGLQRTTGNNQFVAGCPDEWDFILDPTNLGEDLGYWRTDLKGGNWRRLKTKTTSWSDQGLRYYKGNAWYRCAVAVPEQFKGKKILLWFGGVDELATVWVNGRQVGSNDGREFIPFEFDATDAVLFGKPNVIAVRIVNKVLDELGTGGITAPVMFYATEK